jgi:hypothetical protein
MGGVAQDVPGLYRFVSIVVGAKCNDECPTQDTASPAEATTYR